MKAAILAAGEGKRLRNILGERPKPLLEVCGVPLIERIILSLIKRDIRNLVVIIRKDATQLKEFLKKKERELAVKITVVQENTKSAMFSFFALEPFLKDEPFFLFTVDTIYKEQDLSLFVDFCRSNFDADMIIGVTQFILDEKPVFAQINEQHKVTGFGRKYVQSGKAVSAGMYYCSPRIYREKNEALKNNIKHSSDFFGWVVAKGYHVLGFPVSKVIDVDDENDLREAAKFLSCLDSNK